MKVLDRLEAANKLLDTIKSCGKKFFENSHGYETKLIINDESGLVFFVDDYTGKNICIRGEHIMSPNFSHGGGLNALIVGLSRYVRRDEKLRAKHLGHYWGYGDDIYIVRKKALELGVAV